MCAVMLGMELHWNGRALLYHPCVGLRSAEMTLWSYGPSEAMAVASTSLPPFPGQPSHALGGLPFSKGFLSWGYYQSTHVMNSLPLYSPSPVT